MSRSPRWGIPAIFEENEHVFPHQARDVRRRQAGDAREEEVISEAAAALTAA